MKINLTKKIVYGLTVGSLFLSFGGLALANDALPNDATHKPGIISQADHKFNPGDMKQHLTNKLDKLVNAGTITRDQADKVITFFTEKQSQRKAEMDKVKNMSPEDRKTCFEQNSHKRLDFIAELKNSTDLSDVQAKAIAEAVRPPQRPNHGDMGKHISKNIDELVNKGTITRIQADNVIQFFKEKNSQRKAEMDKVKNMSPEDRKTYFQQKSGKHQDLINELKSATNLTDEQVKTVAEAIRPSHGPNHNGQGPMIPRT